jgi:hypothetical protein
MPKQMAFSGPPVGDDLKLVRELSRLQPDGAEGSNSFQARITINVERQA